MLTFTAGASHGFKRIGFPNKELTLGPNVWSPKAGDSRISDKNSLGQCSCSCHVDTSTNDARSDCAKTLWLITPIFTSLLFLSFSVHLRTIKHCTNLVAWIFKLKTEEHTAEVVIWSFYKLYSKTYILFVVIVLTFDPKLFTSIITAGAPNSKCQKGLFWMCRK